VVDLTRTDIRYRDLAERLDWTEEDAQLLSELAPQLRDLLSGLSDEILRSVDPGSELGSAPGGGGTGAASPMESIQEHVDLWIEGVLSGPYDRDYLMRLWQIGLLQAEAGLASRRTVTLLLLRLRSALVDAFASRSGGDGLRGLAALQKRLDLDLAVIQDAYAAAAEPEAASSARMTTLQQIMGGLAHELRQPLNTIRGSAYYLGQLGLEQQGLEQVGLEQGGALSAEKTAEHLERIGRQVEYADQILGALSTFVSLPAPAAAPLSLGESLEEALERNPVSGDVVVTIGNLECAPTVLADPGQLQIVFGNLLRNAREAMAEGGCLDVVARRVGDQVEVAVSDTGCGIAARDLPRVLDPLFTTKPRGMGLGLAISRLLLETLGGGIQVASELGRGTTFTLTLPAASASLEPAAPEGSP